MLEVELTLVFIVAALFGIGRMWWSARYLHALVDGNVGPTLVDRMDDFLQPYEGLQLDVDELRALEVRAERHFIDVLAGDGLTIHGWRLVLHNDDLLGPRCFVKNSAGTELSLAEFQLGHRRGTIDIQAG
jgi:hypothetical protein